MNQSEIKDIKFILENKKFNGGFNPKEYNIFEDFNMIKPLCKVLKTNKKLKLHKLAMKKL